MLRKRKAIGTIISISSGRWSTAKGQGETYIIRSRNGNTILKWMPAHMQYLLVEIDLIGISLLSHSCTLTDTSSWAPGSGATLFTRCGIRGTGGIDRRRNAYFLCFEGGFVGLKDNFCFCFGIGRVNHEIVVVATCHYVAAIAREDHFEFIKDTVVFVCIT